MWKSGNVEMCVGCLYVVFLEVWKSGNLEMCSSCFNLITLEVWKSGNVESRKCVWDGRWGGGGVLRLIFSRYVLLASESPYPIIVYSVANYRPHLSQFWAKM